MSSAVAYYRSQHKGRVGLASASGRNALRLPASPKPGIAIVLEFTEIETGKGADALDRRPQLTATLALARQAKCPGRRGKARSPLPRPRLHCRPCSGFRSCRRARRRCRSHHAAPLRGTGREGAPADLGAHKSRPRFAQNDRHQVRPSRPTPPKLRLRAGRYRLLKMIDLPRRCCQSSP